MKFDINWRYSDDDMAEAFRGLLEEGPGVNEFEADIHTYFGAVREFSAVFLGTFYQMYALFKRTTPPLTASLLAAACALITGAGSSYTHYELDRQHQTGSEKKPKIGDSSYSSSKSSSLSYAQCMLLLTTAFGQANDSVGFPSNILDIAAEGLINNNHLLVIRAALFMLGLMAAWAEIRACKIAMQINNGSAQPEKEDPGLKADGWSKFSIFMKVIQIATTSGLFWARAFDQFIINKKATPMGVSIQGLYAALPLTVFITFCTVFYQHFININNQGHFDHNIIFRVSEESERCALEGDNDETSSLAGYMQSFVFALKAVGILHDDISSNRYVTRGEKFLLLGRLLGSAGEFAETLSFLILTALSPQWFLPVLFACLVTGIVISISDARTARNNLEDNRKKSQTLVSPEHKVTSLSSFFCCTKPEKDDLEQPLTLST